MWHLLIVLVIFGCEMANSKDIFSVSNSIEMGQSIDRDEILLYSSSKNSSFADILTNSSGWIPANIKQEINDTEGKFLIAATRFISQRPPSSITQKTLLNVQDIVKLCKCRLFELIKPSSSELIFESETRRSGISIASSNYVKVFQPKEFHSLPIGQQFLQEQLGIDIRTASFSTFQIAWDFDSFFKSTRVISFYFPVDDERTEIISVVLSRYNNRVNGFIRKAVKSQMEKDLVRVARQVELNGK